MVKKIIRFFIPLIFALIIFIAQIAASNLLPAPWSRINFIMIAAVWILIFREKYIRRLWLIFALSLLTELFHSAPFGLNTAALAATVFLLDWLLVNVLTNRFFPIVFVAGLAGIIVYRAIFLSLIYMLGLFGGQSTAFNPDVFIGIGWEALINSFLLTLAYIIYGLTVKQSSPKYISKI